MFLVFLCKYFVNSHIQELSWISCLLYYTMSGTGGEWFFSFHIFNKFLKILSLPMLHAAHGRVVVKLLHCCHMHNWCLLIYLV